MSRLTLIQVVVAVGLLIVLGQTAYTVSEIEQCGHAATSPQEMHCTNAE